MRKIFVLTAIIFGMATGNIFAQNNTKSPLAIGENQINAGTGFYSGGFPIYASMDFRIHPDITVGPQINFVFMNDFHFVVSARGDYHFNRLLNIPNTWDLYSGLTVGIDFSRKTSFSSGIHVGGRWYWSKTWGLNLEIGGGTYFNTSIGISMRL